MAHSRSKILAEAINIFITMKHIFLKWLLAAVNDCKLVDNCYEK